jgi:two-component system sensor histidine kinase MtrB
VNVGSLAELSGITGATLPVAMTVAVVAVRDRVRSARRRRALNERLHELRRPLQALVLAAKPASVNGPDPLELALAALRDLDREVNGERPELSRRPVEARMLAIAAAERWRARGAAAGRRIAVRWRCADEIADVDPVRVAQALDNLIANALEHGSGEITIEGARRGARIELAVRDRGARRPRRLREKPEPRRGHGLRLTLALARRNGGALRMRTTGHGTVAALELPLAGRHERIRFAPAHQRR